MVKTKAFFCVIILFYLFGFQSYSQIVIDGTISSGLPVTVNNILVTVEYSDSSTTVTDTVRTDTLGYYISSINTINATKAKVFLESCTGSPNIIQKSITLPGTPASSATVNFSNYCFSVIFTHYEIDDTTYFTSVVSGGVTINRYLWDFGDTSALDTNVNPFNAYSSMGQYSVTLKVISVLGDTAEFNDSIFALSCQASFTSTQPLPLQIQFANNTFSAGNPYYLWDFGDTSTSATANPTHNYLTAGSFNVCLTAIDTVIKASNTFCSTINAYTFICESFFSADIKKCIVKYYDQSTSISSTQNLSHIWFFGDSAFSTSPSPVHIYTQNGNYQVQHIIFDNSIGCLDTGFQIVNISQIGPNQIIIAGDVTYSNQPRDGFVELFKGSQASNLTLNDTMSSFDSQFAFPADSNEIYYLKARLHANDINFNNSVPTYFPNKLLWSNATALSIKGSSVFDNDIEILKFTPNNGNSSVSGNVRYNSTNLGAPDVAIYAVDQFDTPVDMTVTDINGDYSLQNVPNGSINIYPEVTGKSSIPSKLFITSASTISNVNFTIYDAQIIGFENETSKLKESLKIYPNPASNLLILEASDNFNYEIIDTYGRVIIQSQIKKTMASSYTLDISQLENGMYLVKVRDDEKIWVFNFVKISE